MIMKKMAENFFSIFFVLRCFLSLAYHKMNYFTPVMGFFPIYLFFDDDELKKGVLIRDNFEFKSNFLFFFICVCDRKCGNFLMKDFLVF